MTDPRPSATARRPRVSRAACIACAALLPLLAAAQAIQIQTPQLPPRAAAKAGTQPGAGQATQPGQPAGQGQQPGWGQPQPQPQQPGWGQPQQQPGWGQPQQQPGWGQPQAQPGWGQQRPGGGTAGTGSPLQQQRAGGGTAQRYGEPQHGGQPQVAMVAPTPSAAGGTCRVQPAPDRQSMSLLGPDGLPRRHVPLGDFRVQLVVHSPDGLWAVAYTKLRGEPQYAAMTLDLTRCETTNTFELAEGGEDVRFEGDSAVLQLARGERRVRLANVRVR
jgi:hypothetical protein